MPKMVITLPVSQMSLTPIKTLESFESIMDEIFDEKPYLADYAKAIDAKSTVTFNHSINVALMTYAELSKDSRFTPEDVKKYTAAAFAHDVGKLTTPDELLHAGPKENLSLMYNNQETKRDIIMRHSIDGYNIAKSYGFNKEEIAACITHHIADSALEAGQEGDYKGATASRESWEISFGDGYIESLLKEELPWVSEKDIIALETISFSDVVEALRDNSRSYKIQNEWNKRNAENKPSIEQIATWDIKDKKMNPHFIESIMSQDFRKETDFYITAGSPQRMRELVAEKTQNRQSVYVLSETKVNEILDDPEVGVMFIKDVNGQARIDLGHGQVLDIGKKEVLSFEDVSLKNVSKNVEQIQNVTDSIEDVGIDYDD